MNSYCRIIALVIFYIISFQSFSQVTHWVKDEVPQIKKGNDSYLIKNQPQKYSSYQLQYKDFTESLPKNQTSKKILLPNEKGGLIEFMVRESSYLSEELRRKFSMITSYSGYSLDNAGSTVKISVGNDGVHATIYHRTNGTVYIDPMTRDNLSYMVYNRQDLNEHQKSFSCGVETQIKKGVERDNFQPKNADDGVLRTYRLAVVASGGYSQFHLNNQGVSSGASDAVKKAAVLSAINTTMTRVNGVYEKDLGVRMVLVANNDEVIFLDALTDGITDGNAGTMINQVQTICDNVIGDANYDVGHVFGIGGSGLARFRSVCGSGIKARGVTGISQPIADPFDIDYVSHELGHQFGASHTQNNACNRSSATAVEPGSASTIMGYAGICSPNVQNNSDDHFHAVSIAEMWSYIQTGATCSVNTNTGNSAPTANAGSDFTIPRSTPFVLRGTATDADGMSSLTYNWEQIDNEVASMPPSSTNAVGPMFRSLPSKTTPNRYMPDLSTVIAGATQSTWEVVPSVSRNMEFAFTVRDNHPGGGNSARDDMIVTVDDSAGPFMVTSQTTNVTWDVGTSQTVTWDVAGTNTGNVNTPTVNIRLSTDGGQTFPILLASSIPNNGTHTFSVPAVGGDSTQMRVMVEGENNIFYAVNSTNFSLQESEFALTVDNSNLEVCQPDNAVFTFTYNTFLGFNGVTTFTASGLPSGLNTNFNPASASADNTVVTLTISGTNNVSAAAYNFTITGNSGSLSSNADATVGVFNNSFPTQVLLLPANGATDVEVTPTMEWDAIDNASSYDLEIATDINFNSIVVSENVPTNSVDVNNLLSQSTTYYWRVKPKNNCGEGSYSSTFSFTTEDCNACSSVANIDYETSTTRVVFNTIDNSSAKPSGYTNYSSIMTNIKRNDSYDLSVNVNTDGNFTVHTIAWIDWNHDCDFDDDNETYDLGTTFGEANGITSLSPLSIQVPSNASIGATVLRVSTRYNADPTSCQNGFDGEVEDYTVIIEEETASTENVTFEGFFMYPNPTNGNFTLRFKTNSSDEVKVRVLDLSGRTILNQEFSSGSTQFAENIVLNRVSSGMYLVQIQNGNQQITRKLIVE